jgi:hypothetical protein
VGTVSRLFQPGPIDLQDHSWSWQGGDDWLPYDLVRARQRGERIERGLRVDDREIVSRSRILRGSDPDQRIEQLPVLVHRETVRHARDVVAHHALHAVARDPLLVMGG